jgi:hypothetical protein
MAKLIKMASASAAPTLYRNTAGKYVEVRSETRDTVNFYAHGGGVMHSMPRSSFLELFDETGSPRLMPCELMVTACRLTSPMRQVLSSCPFMN